VIFACEKGYMGQSDTSGFCEQIFKSHVNPQKATATNYYQYNSGLKEFTKN